jgi:hypothetical protein
MFFFNKDTKRKSSKRDLSLPITTIPPVPPTPVSSYSDTEVGSASPRSQSASPRKTRDHKEHKDKSEGSSKSPRKMRGKPMSPRKSDKSIEHMIGSREFEVLPEVILSNDIMNEIEKKVKLYSFDLHNYFKYREYPAHNDLKQFLTAYWNTLEMQAKIQLSGQKIINKEPELKFTQEYMEEMHQNAQNVIWDRLNSNLGSY